MAGGRINDRDAFVIAFSIESWIDNVERMTITVRLFNGRCHSLFVFIGSRQ